MIQNYRELKDYLQADLNRYGHRKLKLLGWFCGDESYVVKRLLKRLRWLEYYTNKKKRLWDYPLYFICFLLYRRLRLKTGIHLEVNTIGKGLYIPHYGGGIYANCEKLGDFCIISSGVVLGIKGSGRKKGRPIIGNNVEICVGAKVIGNVHVGNNVIIAPNSVVITDIPDNAIVSGVPAKIIKIKDIKDI